MVRQLFDMMIGTARTAQEGLVMFEISRSKHLTAMLSVVAIGAALSFGMGVARAGDEITEQQILKALPPEQRPLTRGLSTGPQADPAATTAEGKFAQTIRGRSTRSLSATERDEIGTILNDDSLPALRVRAH